MRDTDEVSFLLPVRHLALDHLPTGAEVSDQLRVDSLQLEEHQ